jgi:hypothetical protein
MTITPDQAKKLTEEEKKAMGDLERKIDKTLREEFQNNYSNRVIYPLPSAGLYSNGSVISSRIRKEIIRIYAKVGWNVKYECNQMDGEWLEFVSRR